MGDIGYKSFGIFLPVRQNDDMIVCKSIVTIQSNFILGISITWEMSYKRSSPQKAFIPLISCELLLEEIKLANVMIINGSARTKKGDTAFVLTPLIKGMENAGAKVELLYSKKQKILPCTGCFKCWGETIGDCFIDDDMQRIYPKLRETDILVLATPVYIPLPGKMQYFINRLCPLVEPLLEYKNGRTRAKFHENVKISKLLGVITGGWWEIENLSVVLKIMEEITLNTSIEFTGAILRPHAYALREETEINKGIISTLETIGEQIIKEGKIDKENLEYISQPLVNKEDYITKWNKNYLEAKRKQIIDK